MAKYKDQGRKYGKKILAVLLAVATVLTTSSIDMQVLAATYGGDGGTANNSINVGGSLGELVTNTGQTKNQQLNKLSFMISQDEGYDYNVYVEIYENPSKNPTDGVLRKSFNLPIGTGSGEKEVIIGESQDYNVDISTGNDGNPIVLTDGETLGVSVKFTTGGADNKVSYYETTEGTGKGFRKLNASSLTWLERNNIIKVETKDYDSDPDDAAIATFNVDPDKDVIDVGESLSLSTTITPAYKRTVTYYSDGSGIDKKITVNGSTATGAKPGTATLTATCGSNEKTKDIKVVESRFNTTEETYSCTYGEEPDITVKCDTNLTKGTDYKLVYDNDESIAGTSLDVGYHSVVVEGVGDYAGYESGSLEFQVTEKALAESMINVDSIVIDTTNNSFVSATVTDGDKTLDYLTDYNVDVDRTSYSTTGIYYSITFTGINNYTDPSTPIVINKSFAPGSTTIDINSIFDADATKITIDERTFLNEDIDIGYSDITFVNKDGEVVTLNETQFNQIFKPITQDSDRKNVGTKTIKLEGKTATDSTGKQTGYTGEIYLHYTIKPRSLMKPGENQRINVNVETKTYTHDKSAHTPKVTVTYYNGTSESTDLVASGDVEVKYSDNVNIGTATVKITGKTNGNYSDYVEDHFTILPDFENDATVSIEGSPTTARDGWLSPYNGATYQPGTKWTPNVKLFMGNNSSDPGDETRYQVYDFTCTYEDNEKPNDGPAKVHLIGKSGTDLDGLDITAYFIINKRSLNSCTITYTQSQKYSGEEVTTAYSVKDGTITLAEGDGGDFDVSYIDNTNVGKATINFTGRDDGNYTGTVSKQFTIQARPVKDLTVTIDNQDYTGSDVIPDTSSAIVKLGDVIIDPSNYYFTKGKNSVGPGEATAILHGQTNLTGTREDSFTIDPMSLVGLDYYVDGAICTKENNYTYKSNTKMGYTGSEVQPELVIKDGDYTLQPDVDYIFDYNNNINAGWGNIFVYGQGKYAGSESEPRTSVKFEIVKKSIKNDADVNLKTPSYEWREISGTKYVFPSVTVTDKTTGKALTEAERNADGTYKMVGGKYVGDYIIESTATAVGENLTATIKGVNNYDVEGGDVTVTYNAGKNIAGASVSILLPNGGVVEKDESTKVYEVTYIGQNHPDIHVIDGKALTEETDFHINWPSSLIYDANKGTNTVTIEGMGDYYGTVETKYKIIPKNLSTTTDPEGTADIVVSGGTTKVYDGKTYDIAPAIKYFVYRAPSGSGKQDIIVNLTKGSNADYTTDPNSIGADVTGDDTITATVEGQNNYTGTVTTGTVTSSGYGINQRSINDDYIEIEGLNAKEYYTGSQITPEPTIYLTNGETDRSKWIKLTKGTDYDVTYGENVNTSGTVSISGKGNYKDACVKTFTIEKRSILDDTITIRVEDKKTYNGEEQKPYVELVSTIGSETYYLRETVDYELICPQDLNTNDESNVLVGEGNATSGPRVTIKGIGKYSGETTKGFRITGNLNDSEYFQVGELDGQAVDQKYYTINKSVSGYSVDFGSAYNIQYADSAHKGTVVSPHSECTLTQPSTIAPGKRTAMVTSSNSLLTGDCAKEVELHGSLADLSTVEVNTNQPYTGYPVEPVPTLVKYNNVDLTGSSAYKVTYDDDHTSVGSHKLYLRPNSDYYTGYYGPIDYTVSYDLGKADVTLSYWTTTYDGTEQKPEVTSVKVGANTVPESEYTVSYSADTTNSGKKTVTVTGTGSTLTGIATAEYTINPRTLTNNNTNITLDQTDWDYTGKEIKPVVTVECTELGVTDKTLKLGSDYTVAYPEDRISAGNKVITINATTDGLANYRGSVTATYNVKKGTLNADEIQVSDAIYAGGYAVTPTITGTFNGKEINPDTDLEIVSNTSDTPNWGVGTATIKLKGKGNFAETPIITKTYNIVAANLNDTTIELEDNWHEYTGSDLTSTAENNMVVKIDAGGGNFVPLTYGTHYTLQFGDGGEMTNHGQYSVKIIAVPGSNYTGTVSDPTKYYYTVNEKYIDQDDIVVTLNKYQWEYEEVPVNPTVTVYDSSRGEYLTEGEDADYTVYTYDNTEAGVGTVEITGHGNYYGYKNTNFTIGHVFNADVSLDKEEFYYDGPNSLHQPDTIVTQDGVTLEKDKDYSVQYKNVNDDGSYSELDGNAGTKVAIVTGINNYTGNYKTKEYKVKAKTADASKIRVVPKNLGYESGHYYATYTGDYIEPSVTVYDDEISSTIPVNPENYEVTYANHKDMTKSGNYAKIYVNWKDRGTKSNYTTGSDAYTTEFEIKAKEVKPGDFEATIVDETPGQSKIYAYTGDVIKPKVSVRDVNQDIYLTEGTDYVLSYTDNVKAGTGYVTVKGLNNYSGTVTLDFTIQAQMSDAVAPIPDQLFTGEPVKPKFTVTCGGNTLVEGVDYNVSYRSDDDYQTSGVAKIDTNSPYYSGSKEIKYNIVFDPSLLTVTNYNPTYTYTGGSIRPDFVVQAPDGTIIPYDKNAVTYMNSSTGAGDTTSIGTITASIPVTIGTPENHKTAVLKAVYSIVSKNVNNASVTVARLADNVYTGKALTPPVYIKDGNTQLTEGVDYTLSYSNNTNPGVGTVIITGKGEYEGQRSEPFYIIAPKVLGLTGTVGSDSSVTLSWLKNAHVSGYDIYSQDGSKKYGSTTANSFNIPASKAGNETVFKVRTYVTVNGKRTDGEFSEVTVYTGLAKPVVTITSYARKRATLNWSPQTNVSGYEIYRGTSPDGNFSKIAVMPTTSGGYSDSGLTSGQTYYYKVRAYQKTGENAFVYGHFSDVKSVVVK